MSLLIVTSENDITATLTIEELKKRAVKFTRFDTNLFQKESKLSLNLSSNGSFEGKFCISGKIVDFSEFSLVWFRRVANISVDPVLDEDPAIKQWVEEETKWALYYSLTMLEVPVVNPFNQEGGLQRNKWVQMREAAKLGFKIPLSKMTNNLEEISEFWSITNKEMIFKKVKQGLGTLSDGRRILVHTSKLDDKHLTESNLKRMRFCPMFLQQCIPKKFDIRCVIIGNRIFSFAIHSQENENSKIDYRQAYLAGGQKNIKHEYIKLDDSIESKLITFVKTFNHHFGVIDLVETPDGDLVFFRR